jgi:hypothetical protein
MDVVYTQKQTFLYISITHKDFSNFFCFAEVADEPTAEKLADEKGGSNDRGKYL